MAPVLVERRAELSVVLGELEAAGRHDHVGTSLVRGVGGIGKTALVREVVARAAAEGSVALVGRADAFDRGRPLGVFRDALDHLVVDPSDPAAAAARDALRAVLGAPAAPARPAVRQLDQALAGLVRLLGILARPAPVVVVLEDLHVADPESITLYGLLARQLVGVPVLFVLTVRTGYREVSDLERFVERMADDDRASVIELGPLSSVAVAQLVATEVGEDPAADLLAVVAAEGGGNPYFVKALIERWRTDDGSGGGGATPPPGGPALLGRFFEPDGPEARVAQVLAVLGRSTVDHLAVLARLSETGPAELEQAFDRLVARRLVVATGEGAYELAHPLLADALYDDLGVAERRRVHAAVADLLLERRRVGSAVDLFELATHVAASATPGDPSASATALEAADWAMGNAPLVAAGWYEQAASLMVLTHPDRPVVVAQRVYALMIGSQTRRAVEVAVAGLGDVRRGQDRTGLAFAAINALYAADRIPEALRLVDGELAAGTPSFELRALRASLLGQVDRVAEAEAEYRRARGEAALAADVAPDAVVGHLTGLTQLLCHADLVGDAAGSSELRREIRRLLVHAPPSLRAEFLHFLCAQPGLGAGYLRQAALDMGDARSLRGGLTGTSAGGNGELVEVIVAWFEGRWDDAVARARSAVHALEVAGSTTAVRGLRAVAGLVLIDRGDLDAATDLVGDLDPGPAASRPYVAVARARLERATGQNRAAADRLRVQFEAAADLGQRSMCTLVGEELVRIELDAGNEGAAASVARRALALVEGRGAGVLEVFGLRAVALATGDHDAARQAVAVAEAEDLVVEVAKGRLVLGELGEEPLRNLRAAHDAFVAVGAGPWRRRAAVELRRYGHAVPRRHRSTGELSATEQEIARLVVEGLTNKRIAVALNYSVKTVEVYLSRIYATVGCASRVELARAVFQGTVDLGATEPGAD